MLALLVSPDHGVRLRELLARFRREEAELAAFLRLVQQDVERAHQVLARERLGVAAAGGNAFAGGRSEGAAGAATMTGAGDEPWPGHQASITSLRLLCVELEAQHEAVASELLDVRLAVVGTEEELARHDFLLETMAAARSTPA